MGDGDEATVVYKTKAVQFLGRSTPIILQNDNGPCPLLAISNVLLLRNIIQLSPDTTEVPLQRLLSLVAERLLDSNSSAENQDIGYVQNQQQNISDAIDLLPRLATGIDVNVRFRHIHDFEFTRECAIFDLLDIGLVHGWIIDPQDEDTARVIGSKSYNTLMEELVALDASKTFESPGTDADDDAVDFAAATTATLGVPCPSLTRGKSFEESPTASLNENQEKSSVQEDEDLMKALDLSKIDLKEDTAITKCTDSDQRMVSEYLKCQLSADSVVHDVEDEKSGEFVKNLKSYSPTVQDSLPCSLVSQELEPVIQPLKDRNLVQNDIQNSENMLDSENPASGNKADYLAQSNITSNSVAEKTSSEQPGSAEDHKKSESCTDEDATYEENTDNQFLFPHDSNSTIEIHTDSLPREESNYIDSDQHIENKPALEISVEHAAAECVGNDSILESNVSSKQLIRHTDEKRESPENTEEVCSSLADSEPLYEGEDCILSDHVSAMYENREPLYEGEVALAEQADNAEKQDDRLEKSDESCLQEQDETLHTTAREGMLIKTYLRSNASQLTVYGLFCLQEGLKERELCVFFRNNHFNTMFKFNGELYLLATDQGYINQPDLVWEKLNEVHGDTVFMTGDFKEFKVGESLDTTWNQHQAASKTADYIAAVSNLQQEEEINSDLQLAIALQKQEFDQQQPQPQPQQQQQPQPRSQQQHHQRNTPSLMTSRMVTGPDASRSSSSVTKQESKLKDKCAIM